MFNWGLYNNFEIPQLRIKINKLAINFKQETICIIFTHPSPNPSVPQNIAWQYNVTNLT